MQVVSVEQDTPDIVPRVTFGSGDGTGLVAQVEPFQFSAIGRVMPFLTTDPTALQPMLNCVVLHDTLENWLLLPDGTAAVPLSFPWGHTYLSCCSARKAVGGGPGAGPASG